MSADGLKMRTARGTDGLKPARVLVTGGAGFVGTNVAFRLLGDGHDVVVLDDLSRTGVRRNLARLRAAHPELTFLQADVRDHEAVAAAMAGCAHVFHFAAQTAVTTSVLDPREDFGVNLEGTLNVLEVARCLFTSTNKVYGDLADVGVTEVGGRYEPERTAHRHGIGEDRPLDFCSPYGCSKGGADQYVLDYAKSYGLRTVVFRMSCIYGQHQQGNEDQGWVAHFLRSALAGEPITLYGDGRQVRDVLHVDDLVAAMLRAAADVDRLAGRAFNIGGGPGNTTSLLELVERIDALHGRTTKVGFAGWRVGDQRWYVSDTRAFQRAAGWLPTVDVATGVARLYEWLAADERLATAVAG
jgi:CDP-paratose 2-epimerase